MAGFFGFFDYTKPGPGVPDPDSAPPKARIVVFFEIFTRKFWNLVKLNLMFTLFNLPAILIALVFISNLFIQKTILNDINTDLIIKFLFVSIFLCIPVLTVGPAQAGFTYVLRNYSREEHAFLWWDFKETALKNLKESLIISVIDFIVVVIVGIDINLYMNINKGSFLMTVAGSLVFLAFTIYVMMHMYIYPMLVTFKLNVRQLYKNAFLFAIMRFIPNLLILLLCIVVLGASFYNAYLGFILFPLLTMSLIGLITNFYVYPTMKKYMIDKVTEQENSKKEEQENSEEEIIK